MNESRIGGESRRVTGLALNDQVDRRFTGGAARGRRTHCGRRHCRGAQLRGCLQRADGPTDRGRRTDGARRLPATGCPFARVRSRARRCLPALDGAYELGRGEARQGRSMDALLSAYRVGARVAWRELSDTAVDRGLPPLTIARFAELVFAFIDELSAASVSGHADELASSDRERRRGLDRLGRQLLAGAPIDTLLSSAETVELAATGNSDCGVGAVGPDARGPVPIRAFHAATQRRPAGY